MIKYPSEDRIIQHNIFVINFINVKKADEAKVLNKNKLVVVLQDCMDRKGDVYDKAVVLLKGLVKAHAFASGNRRTAFVATKEFILLNKGKFKIPDDPSYARVMIGIREGYYSDDEIKEWIKNGKIREFRRN